MRSIVGDVDYGELGSSTAIMLAGSDMLVGVRAGMGVCSGW